jgi:trk system potassium uptake protein TrkH
MVRVNSVLNVLAVMTMIFAAAMMVPAAVALVADDAAQSVFEKAVLITLIAGILLWGITRSRRRELQPRDGFLLVALVWTVLPAFATLPLLMFLPELSFTDAYFETVSGLTASGGTILSGLDALPPSINFWRMFLVWMGGMGVVVLAVAILPLLGVGGSQMFKAETPGPMKDAKLTPRIAETAKGLWGIYALITIACIVSLKLAGMTWFDATVHSFSTMGLGGFSTHDASFGFWNSPAIEAVTIFFMLLAGINFGTHFLAFRRRDWQPYKTDPEAWVYLLLVTGSCFIIAWFLLGNRFYEDFWTALRYASFNVVSVATTTGFSNTDYGQWPIFAPVWMLFLCGFATCSGSTGGGIKMVRAVIMVKQTLRELKRIVHPRAYIPVKLAGSMVENNIVFAVLAFMLVYGGTVTVLTMLLTASGLDLITSASAIIACVNNTGPGLAKVGPSTTYAVLTDFQTWLCTIAMLLGRLELMTLLVVFTPGFWRH